MQPIQVLFEFFWLICGVVAGAGNAIHFRVSLVAPISRGEVTKIEADRFALGVLGWIGGPCVSLWFIQRFLAKSPDVDFRLWASPFNIAGIGIVIAVWLVAFVWIWFFGGDRHLARIYSLARHQAFLWGHPIVFRILIILVIASGTIGLLFGEPIAIPFK